MFERTFFDFRPIIANAFLLADLADAQRISLVIGVGTLAGGVLLLLHHKRHLDSVLTSDASERVRLFELRKFRRRALASALIASLGSMMSALFWVTDQRVFATLILMILGLLVGIAGLAMFDLFFVGLHQLGETDKSSQKAMIEEFLRKREEGKNDTEES